ncbi:Predicted PurR-regulated permease PerM [Faunimonas pinastri]|uniref:Predicted PurR-regulated permease PerM n=1 Tax=Faunimonas pinastri TaxID=1855383 RepID=A0A1H8ZIE4_9HYPH|nr:AI-2E family transporter [Faunimonas pinastri]SEP64095.1 Predicted PurR-regulated permease PerM [Faunimonas pinastri]
MASETPENAWSPGAVARLTVLVASIFVALAAGCFILWKGSAAFFVIFGGLLLAVVLDAGASALGRILHVRRSILLVALFLILMIVLGGAVSWGGATLVDQAGRFTSTFSEQTKKLNDLIASSHLPFLSGESLKNLLPSGGAMFGGATNAVVAGFGVVGNFVLMLFLGAFLAWEPETYKMGFLSLLPKEKRERVGEALDEAGVAMRGWFLGQLVSMAIVGVATLLILWVLGFSFPLLLAVMSGLLVFIPTIGPTVAGGIIILAGLAQSPSMALYGLGAYLVIQALESNIVTPMVQERVVSLPAAYTLGFQLLFGALFGIPGLALAVPISAAVKTLVLELYVEDGLGGAWKAEDEAEEEEKSRRNLRRIHRTGHNRSGERV